MNVDPPTPSHLNMSTSNARPVIMRIVSLENDLPKGILYDGPFQIDERYTKIEIHLSYSSFNKDEKTLPDIGLPK